MPLSAPRPRDGVAWRSGARAFNWDLLGPPTLRGARRWGREVPSGHVGPGKEVKGEGEGGVAPTHVGHHPVAKMTTSL